ncbi:MAG: DUF262 domain-containing protein [Deltaproteobacteria bacterium]|jgi:uncharacterized protein with ParB-like and HNH nuclease domain|nr:DUF262 domain-containing protein [Deltaproteobacteria bacterium]
MEANTRDLERIFDQTISYQVPLFQRPYVWTREENWLPLWEDIQSLLDKHLTNGDVHPHFLGAIVLEQMNSPTGSIETRQLIDGQQRLTTLQIFLIAARDLCQLYEIEKYNERFGDLVSNKKNRIENDDEVFKVWPTNSDREAFSLVHSIASAANLRKHYKKGENTAQLDDSIADAYLYFSLQLEDWLTGKTEDFSDEKKEYSLDEYLESLWQIVCRKLLLVVIDLGKDDESQVIFETLNARGTQLLPADLVKNYLFRKAETNQENIEKLYDEYWKPFDDSFWRKETKQGRLLRPRIDLFLQHYLALKTLEDVKVNHIFNVFKHFEKNNSVELVIDPVRSPSTPGEHTKALHQYGTVFKEFYQPIPGTRTSVFLTRLAAVDTATVYPFLLEAFRTLADSHKEELEKILVCLESYLIRRMICGLTMKNYNRFFIELIKSVQKSSEYSELSVVTFLLKSDSDSTRFPKDDEFKRAWLEFPVYDRLAQYKIRSILSALDAALQTGKSEAIALPDKLTIEHIMPRKWKDHWPLPTENPDDPIEKQEKQDKRNILKHSFGNLTLITNSLNPSLSNGSWSTKRPEIIKFSKLNLNQYFHDVEEWDESAIKIRGKELLDLSLKIWPYPKSATSDT